MAGISLIKIDRLVEQNIENKLTSYHIVRMEEDEKEASFWIHCGRMVKAIRLFFLNETKMIKISEICNFLHRNCMLEGGVYSKKNRIIGNYLAIDPLYIETYMKT